MKCPKCSYEPTMSEMQQSPDSCTSCGVYYSKVAAKPATASPPEPVDKVTFADWVGSNPSVKWIAALLLGLVIGYFAGREHVKYEIRSAMSESLAGLGAIFSGNSKPAAASSTKPIPAAPKVAPKDSPITAKLVSKDFYEGKYGQDQITTDFAFTNSTDSDIRAFDGVMVITDLLGNDIIRINMAINDPVAKRQTLSWSGGVDYNQFKDSHQRFRNERQENIRIFFEVKKVLYADGRLEQF